MVVLSEYIEGSSSSTNGHKYDVFLSFRGFDTRLGFTDHLLRALQGAEISTFFDDEEIETGGDLKPELESAIKDSKASIIVLSKNYANSSWCLDELVLILGERKASNQIVIPIFYHVEPTHVRKQQSSFGDAMAKHKHEMETETDANRKSERAQKIDRWSQALTEVADLKGMSVDGRRETQFIEEIVKEINRRLRISSNISLPQLIGMDDSKKFVTTWLKDTSTQILTILGMAGIGKTSLAKYVYGLHSHEFNTRSFIDDIGGRCDGKYNGLLDVQKQLHDDISKACSIQVHGVSLYTSKIENVIAHKKVFLVLDDIDSLDQLDALLGSKGFHPESKIIITSKDASLTTSCALFKANNKPSHANHLPQGLNGAEAQQLLCFHAFESNEPKEGYKEVLEKFVEYCQRHPLALKVLGKSLHKRDVFYWEDILEELEKENGLTGINNVLRKSFESLPFKNDKELFKHIACFFVGMDRDFTETILKACGLKTRSGITNLIDKCLLSIGWNNKLKMHRLLQEIGRLAVREESPDKPWKRSRLWCNEESFKVLKQKKGKGNLLGLSLDMRMLEKKKLRGSFKLKTDALSNMDNLMLLQLNYVQISGSYEHFPEELRWLCMHGFPSKCTPSDLQMDNVVALDMSYSNIESFFISNGNQQLLTTREKLTRRCEKDKMLLGSLKILNISFCEQLRSLVGFVELRALERLIATNCSELLEVCDSVQQCVELVYIDLSYCNKLQKLPIGILKKVKTLLLEGCNLGGSQIVSRDTDSAEMIKAILSDSKFFRTSLPSSLVNLSLVNCNLFTESFPMDFSFLFMLEALYLDNNPISSMPNCVRSLPRLQLISMKNCKRLTSVEHPPKTVTYLNLFSDNMAQVPKVVFDPEMCPLELLISFSLRESIPYNMEGILQTQRMTNVEEKVLQSLGWSKLHFLNKRGVQRHSFSTGLKEREIKMYYEFGIFSTIYAGKEMPNWIMHKRKGSSISFTIPSSPIKIRGFNFCYVNKYRNPIIIIHNITKNRTWIYEHCIELEGGIKEDFYTVLSHWMFGMNEMEGGDLVNITVRHLVSGAEVAMECGVSVVYDDQNTDEEDALDYYKSWNHIIGGDLSSYQLSTGEYLLSIRRIMTHGVPPFLRYRKFVEVHSRYKVEEIRFRALSQRKPAILGHVPEETGTSTSSALILNDEDEVRPSKRLKGGSIWSL